MQRARQSVEFAFARRWMSAFNNSYVKDALHELDSWLTHVLAVKVEVLRATLRVQQWLGDVAAWWFATIASAVRDGWVLPSRGLIAGARSLNTSRSDAAAVELRSCAIPVQGQPWGVLDRTSLS